MRARQVVSEELISVIIPVYNTERYLRRCIDSLLKQTYQNLELIVIDNASTDGCADLCDYYAKQDSRIRVIHNQYNSVSVWTDGIKVSKGRYVAFVCSDDWIDVDMYEYLYTILSDNQGDIAVCGNYYTEIDSETIISNSGNSGKVIVYDREAAVTEIINDKKIKSFFWNKLYKKEVWNGIELLPGNTYGDVPVTYKTFLNASKIVVGDCPKYVYYQRKDSVLNSGGKKLWWDLYCSYEDHFRYLPEEYYESRQITVKHLVEFGMSHYYDLLTLNERTVEDYTHMKIIRNRIQGLRKNYLALDVPNKMKIRLLFFVFDKKDILYKIVRRKQLRYSK